MRAVLQRVHGASVSVAGEKISGFDSKGIMVLLGITDSDTDKEVEFISRKIADLRIMEDEKSVLELGLPVMVVSQFTLYGDARKGRRPTWIRAAKGDIAQPLVDKVVVALREMGLEVHEGRFGADMQVAIVNDGPFTILLDTEK